MDRIKPDIANITRYWTRPDTEAAKLKGHPGAETKRRSRIMAKAFRSAGLARNRMWLGWKGKAYAASMNPDGTVTARNQDYKPIVVSGGEIGWMEVEVTECTYFDLRGRVV